jgi:hypothetical protein
LPPALERLIRHCSLSRIQRRFLVKPYIENRQLLVLTVMSALLSQKIVQMKIIIIDIRMLLQLPSLKN